MSGGTVGPWAFSHYQIWPSLKTIWTSVQNQTSVVEMKLRLSKIQHEPTESNWKSKKMYAFFVLFVLFFHDFQWLKIIDKVMLEGCGWRRASVPFARMNVIFTPWDLKINSIGDIRIRVVHKIDDISVGKWRYIVNFQW